MPTFNKTALMGGLMAAFIGVLPAYAQVELPDLDSPLSGEVEEVIFEQAVTAAVPLPPPELSVVEESDDVLIAQGKAKLGPPMRGSGRGGPCPMGFGRGPFGFLQGDLALTDAQYEKLYSIKHQLADTVGPKMAEIRNYQRDLKDALTLPQLDRAKVKALQAKISDGKAAIADAKIESRMNSLEVLTPEQRKELRSVVVKGGFAGMDGGRHFGHRMRARMRG